MSCQRLNVGGAEVLVCGPDHWLSLAPFGAKVWVEYHNYLGPTFYRSESANTEIRNPSRKTWKAFEAWLETKK